MDSLFSLLEGLAIPLIIYIITEAVLSTVTKSPLWVVRQVLNWWREIAYLGNLLRYDKRGENRFVQWNPRYLRYAALEAIHARKGEDEGNNHQPLLELLEKYMFQGKSVIIVGQPGSGKTTALEALTFLLAQRAYRRSVFLWLMWLGVAFGLMFWSPIVSLVLLLSFPPLVSIFRFWKTPIFISLSSYEGQGGEKFFSGKVKNDIGNEAQYKKKDRLIFMLDGINEISDQYYGPFLDYWSSQKFRFPTLFTCRAGEVPWFQNRQKGRDNPVDVWLEVDELDMSGVRQFVEIYLREINAEENHPLVMQRTIWQTAWRINLKPEELSAEVEKLEKEGLIDKGGIGRNPYWLRMIVRSKELTYNRGMLFYHFVRELIQRETDPKREGRKRRPEWKSIIPSEVEMDALASLALAMQRFSAVGFHGESGWREGHQVIREALLEYMNASPMDVLCEGEAATLVRWRFKETIQFTHQSLQEFFTAYALREESRWSEALSYAGDRHRWEMLFVLGGLLLLPDNGSLSEALARLVREIIRGEPDQLRLFASIMFICSMERVDDSLLRDVLDALAKEVVLPLSGEQIDAVQELIRIAGDRAVECLGGLLTRDDPIHRLKGINLLQTEGGVRATDLVIMSLNDVTSKVRKAAAEALGRISDPRAIEPLIAALKDDVREVRREVAVALGWIGEPAVKPLIDVLKIDEDRNFLQEVANALKRIGEPAVEPLISALKDEDWNRRSAAASALERIGEPAIYPLIAALDNKDPDPSKRAYLRERALSVLIRIGEPVVEPLLAALDNNDPNMLRAAVVALGWIGDLQAVEPLIAVLGEDPYMRREAAVALGQIGDPRAVEPLIAVLGEDPYVRREVAVALGSIGDPRAVESLVAALEDEDQDVRMAVIHALGQIGDPRAVEPLIAALDENDRQASLAIVEAFGKIGDPRAIEPLIAALEDGDWNVHLAAAVALVGIGKPAVEPLIVALKDKDQYVRTAAIHALGGIGKPAVDPLITVLSYEDWKVREAATFALKWISDPLTVEPLIATLEDENRNVRMAAFHALGMNGKFAVEPLITALKNEGWEVRWLAAFVLMRINDPRAVKPLIAVLAGKDWKARQAAAVALGGIGEPAVEPLIASLEDEDRGVRWVASTVLMRINDPRAVEPLIAALEDEEWDVRWIAAYGLMRIDDHRAVEPLIAALRDEDRYVRTVAIHAIGEIGDYRAITPLEEILREEEDYEMCYDISTSIYRIQRREATFKFE